MAILQRLYLPKETVSDDTNKVVEIHKKSGDTIKRGDILFTLETSKAAVDIEAETDGLLVHKLKIDQQVDVGGLVAIIVDDDTDAAMSELNADSPRSQPVVNAQSHNNFSVKAAALISEHKIPLETFSGFGFVREKDVRDYLANANNPRSVYSRLDVVLIGGGGHARMCIDVIRQMKGQFRIIGLLDGRHEKGSSIFGVPVLGDDTELMPLYDAGVRLAVNGVGTERGCGPRRRIFENLKSIGYSVPTIIHPSAVVEPSVHLGEGVQVMMGALVGTAAKIEDNAIINSGAIVSHDCQIQAHAHITPGAILAGSVSIGEESMIGMGATIFMGVSVAAKTIVANGKHVFKNIVGQ